MVKVKYPALYTDNLGCEQAEVYFSKDRLELRVRENFFTNDDFNFDFYSDDPEKIRSLFYLKDNELIEYCIDIKIPIILTCSGIEYMRGFLLRIERTKNYYNNSLELDLKGEVYKVEGYNLQELLFNMNKKLPKGYNLEDGFSCIFGMNYIKSKKENNISCSEYYNRKSDSILNKDSYLYLFNDESKNKLEELQKIPINYIHKEFCSS